MTGLLYTTETLFIFVCVFLVLLILIQKGRGGGLASAFGGGGGQTAFGTKTGDVLTWATSIVFGIFLLLAVCLNLIANHIDTVRYGNTAAAAVPLTAAETSTLPKAPTPEPGIRTPEPVASTMPSASTAPAEMSPVQMSAPITSPSTMTATTAPSVAPTTLP